MSHTIIDDDGNEVVVYSQEEIDAQIAEKEAAIKAEYEKQLAEKDAHVKEKLDQFQQAKKSVDVEKDEIRAVAEEAKRLAEEAKLTIEQSKALELTARKDAWIQSVSGGDLELKKKIEESYDLLNLPATSDVEIQERVQKAVTLAGVTQLPVKNLSFSGSYAPSVQSSQDQGKQAAYDAWKGELGL